MAGIARLAGVRTASRCFSTTARASDVHNWDGSVPEQYKRRPKRLAWGISGTPMYAGDPSFPAEAIRFQDDDKHLTEVLRPKEQGPWTKLSLDEKKQLYRTAYQLTVVEILKEDKGRWKSDLTYFMWVSALATLWSMYFMDHRCPLPVTEEFEYKNAEWSNLVMANPSLAATDTFDYEKYENKPVKWYMIN